MNKIIVLVLSIVLLSCKKDHSSQETIQQDSVRSKTDSIGKSNISLKSSSQFTGDWAEIITFENELKRVLNSDVQTEKDLVLLKELLENFKETYPERFKTLAIKARVKVLETEIAMLDQDLKDRFLNDVPNKLIRIQNAYNVFVNQIETLILKERDYDKYN